MSSQAKSRRPQFDINACPKLAIPETPNDASSNAALQLMVDSART